VITAEARQLLLDPVQLSFYEGGLLFQNGLLVQHGNIRLLLARSYSATSCASEPRALSGASSRTATHPSSSSRARPIAERSGTIHKRHNVLPLQHAATACALRSQAVRILQFRQLAALECLYGLTHSPRIALVDFDSARCKDCEGFWPDVSTDYDLRAQPARRLGGLNTSAVSGG
jgi:hypothetical protein